MEKAFSLIKDETMEKRMERHRTASGMLNAGISALGMETVAREEYRSNTVTGLKLKNSSQKDVIGNSLKLGIEFGSGVHPGVKPDYIRIGHMGWVEQHHIIRALSVLERALKAAGETINVGAGVKAAQDYISNSRA